MEEIHYRQEKKKYKDKNIKFAEEGRRYKPKHKKRMRLFMLSGFAVLAAAVTFVAIFVFNNNKEVLSDNILAPMDSAGVAESAAQAVAENTAPQQTSPERTAVASADPPPAASAEPIASDAPLVEVKLEPPAAAPFVYENNGQIILAGGSRRIALGSHSDLYGCYESISALLSGDNRYLYYISGIDISTGAGTLMKAASDASLEPCVVAEGVCAARVSYDGSKVMYFKDMQGAAGSLYAFSDGKEEFIAKNAVPDFFEFSPGGQNICYFTQENDGTFALYSKSSGGAPAVICHITAEAVVGGGINLTRIGVVIPFDNGDVLYSAEQDYNMPLCLFTHGSVKEICGDSYVIKTFTDGGFLYGETGLETKPLWYKAPGAQPVMLSENYDYVKFPDEAAGDAWFLLVERIGDGAENPGVMMYVISKDKIKEAVSLADSENIEINNSCDCVTYERDGKLYASRKTDGGWKETFLSDASVQQFQGAEQSGMHVQFDETGSNLYYSDEYKTGPLYRFSVKDGNITKLISKVDWFRVIGGTPYAHTTNDKLYRFSGGMQMAASGVRELAGAQGGAYAVTDEGVVFIANGAKAKNIGGITNDIEIGSIDCRPPLEQDVTEAIGVLTREADYCLYKLGYFRDKCDEPLGAQEALSLAGKLLARQDIDEEERKLLQSMYDGYSAYLLWTHGDGKREAAKDALGYASSLYETYVNSSEGD